MGCTALRERNDLATRRLRVVIEVQMDCFGLKFRTFGDLGFGQIGTGIGRS
jgi:hypothetical protein